MFLRCFCTVPGGAGEARAAGQKSTPKMTLRCREGVSVSPHWLQSTHHGFSSTDTPFRSVKGLSRFAKDTPGAGKALPRPRRKQDL